ncbi:MAG: DUF5674 family protein [Gemmatimonadales bacterium]
MFLFRLGGALIKWNPAALALVEGAAGALHADCEAVLLEAGSRQDDIWGADWVPSSQEVNVSELDWRRFHDDIPYGLPRRARDTCAEQWTFPWARAEDACRAPTSLEVSYTPGTGAVGRVARLRAMAGGHE